MKLHAVFTLGFIISNGAQSLELENFDLNATKQRQLAQENAIFPAKPQAKLQNKKGSPSHYDPYMDKQTFIWAEENPTNTTPNLKKTHTKKGRVDDISMAQNYLTNHFQLKAASSNKSLAKSAPVNDIYPVSNHVSKFGPVLVKFRQKYNGTDVFAREANVLMDKDRNLVAVSGYLADSLPAKTSTPLKSRATDIAAKAIELAYKDMGIEATISSTIKALKGPYSEYNAHTKNASYNILGAPRSKPVFYEYQRELIPAHYVEVGVKERDRERAEFLYGYVISETPTGKTATQILFRKNQVQQETFSYRTFADTSKNNVPFRGPMKNIYPLLGLTPDEADKQVSLDYDPDAHQLVSLESASISTNDPWLTDGASETVGNNVDAYVDIVPGDGYSDGDIRAETTAHNTFDWAYDAEAPTSPESRKAAVVNLFYMNNWLHDYFYDFGFDEASGNAQADNYGRGGLDGDVLRAEGQDYSGVRNANMLTPADGRSPRMQMYMFGGFHKRGESFEATTTKNGLTKTLISDTLSFVGPEQYNTEGKLVLYASDPADTCAPPPNPEEIVGSIALQIRGFCNNATAVKFAQDAGAKAVIIYDPHLSRSAFIYAPTKDITIPNIGLAGIEGRELAIALRNNEDIHIRMRRDFRANRDGTVANGIVSHEWAHYLTNRLVGDGVGLINPQARGMGEGWSDFVAIYFAIKEEHRKIPGNENFQGFYSSGEWAIPGPYYGIRRVPYTTDMRYNAVLFENISEKVPFEFDHPVKFKGNNTQVHSQGEFWANTLLEVYVSLLNDSERLSFQEAKERMAYYLVAGLKLTPIAPTYTEARDAMLAVAYATDRKDYEQMIAAFAKRGLGVKAVSPERFSTTNEGVVNSFDTEGSAFKVISSRIEIEKTYSDLNLSEHSDPLLSSLSFLDDETFQCPKDGVLDIFEFGEVIFKLDNTGNLPLDDIEAKVTSDAGHGIYFSHLGNTKIQPIVPYSSAIEVRVPFVLFNAKTAQSYKITVEFPQKNSAIDYPSAEHFNLKVHYDFVADDNRTVDTLEDTETSLRDWTVLVDAPEPDAPDYQSVRDTTFVLDNGANNNIYSTGQMWRGLNNSFATDVSLISPTVEISETEPFSFSFEHAHIFEDGAWDGGVVEISIDGGDWLDVKEADGEILGYDYNGTIRPINTQPLAGRDAFVDANIELSKTTVSFDTILAGKTAQFRFRIGTDLIFGAEGWFIDNIGFEGITNSPFSKVVPNKQWCHF